jgi:hypothetical protein
LDYWTGPYRAFMGKSEVERLFGKGMVMLGDHIVDIGNIFGKA